MLSRLTADGGSALIVDSHGLAIDATDEKLSEEIDAVNTSNEAAVLYYRTPQHLGELPGEGAVASTSTDTNSLVEQVLANAGNGDDVVRLDMEGRRALAVRIKSTGWFVVLVRPRP